jgi:hypothetical protein
MFRPGTAAELHDVIARDQDLIPSPFHFRLFLLAMSLRPV